MTSLLEDEIITLVSLTLIAFQKWVSIFSFVTEHRIRVAPQGRSEHHHQTDLQHHNRMLENALSFAFH